jgi:hypothetical protein
MLRTGIFGEYVEITRCSAKQINGTGSICKDKKYAPASSIASIDAKMVRPAATGTP